MKNFYKVITVVLAVTAVLFLYRTKSAEKIKAGFFNGKNEGGFSETIGNSENETENNDLENRADDEMRGVWLSCYEIKSMSENGEEVYKDKCETLLKTLNGLKINTVFFQVRAFSDALYSSSVFPVSKYLASAEGAKLPFDALKIFIDCAKEYNIKVHGWVNPFRVSFSNDIEKISKTNPAYKLYNNKKTDSLIFCEKGIYYNPASSEALKIILDGIRELINNYDISGIHFDDYFYPPCKFDSDMKMYKNYRKNGGTLSAENWRRENLSAFIVSVYDVVKEKNENLIFGVSPSAKTDYNYNDLYADVLKWCMSDGYIDYVMPQIYFGFQNETMNFKDVCNRWASYKRNKGVKLYCGLALYKSGKEDKNAGTGKTEWVENDTVISNQYKYLTENNAFSGFVLFSASYIVGENVSYNSEKELKLLNNVL